MCTTGPRDGQSSARRSRPAGNERDRDSVVERATEPDRCSTSEKSGDRRLPPTEHEGSDRSDLLRTDGGTPVDLDRTTADDSRGQLSSIFVDVTGTETLVEEQDQAPTARYADDGETTPTSETLPEHATAVAKADGLSETLDGPNQGADSN